MGLMDIVHYKQSPTGQLNFQQLFVVVETSFKCVLQREEFFVASAGLVNWAFYIMRKKKKLREKGNSTGRH